jgi:uncharacterized protein (DUF924 family)
MKIRISLIAAAGVAALFATGPAQAGGYNKPAAAKYSAEQVAATLGLHRSESGMWQDEAQQCVASVILLTRKDIKIYADAGDAVATNPARTVGVKVGAFAGADKRMCFDRFEAALKKLG